mmetsp:Transcript_7493/g.19378  ORF Transcript_7493/g.19378 Transcript_7493/m.19378 type:complete len:202 (+) Transcript_7493:1813-2418(+)
MTSMTYACARSSLQASTCSTSLGSTSFAYILTSSPSSSLRSVRFFPTSSRSSPRSFSRRMASSAAPWYLMRTHSLFISAKLSRRKCTASATPASPDSYGDPTSGSLSRAVWRRYERRNKPLAGCCTPLHISTRSRSTSLDPASFDAMKFPPTVTSRYRRGTTFPQCCVLSYSAPYDATPAGSVDTYADRCLSSSQHAKNSE